MADSALFHQLEIPGIVSFQHSPSGLVFLEVSSEHASARIYLQGAHVTHFQPRGEDPLLFMSRESHFTAGKPIRGGVPVIFPWFGAKEDDPSAPAHGFARVLPWEVESVSAESGGEVRIVLRVSSGEATRAAWPYEFVLRHEIVVGRDLQVILEVENRSAEEFRFEEALHTYLKVTDARAVEITGLAGTDYLDKVDGFRRKTQDETPITFTGETDRIYLNTTSACLLRDGKGGRTIQVSKDGSYTTVVWNPWVNKAAALPDFGDDEWPQMACIETANASENAVTLKPGAKHAMRVVVGIAQ